MAQKFVTPITVKQLSSAGSDGLTIFVDGDAYARLQVQAGGRLVWGDGTATGDVNLYRDDANVLKTDDVFKATGGLITLATDGVPTAELPDGALAIDTTNNLFYFRSNSTWNQVLGGGGGASVTVSDTAPVEPNIGDLWFNSSTALTYVYYDSVWVQIGGSPSGVAGSTYTQTIGDGTNDTFVITHNLGTRDVFVTIRNSGSPYEVIDAYWAATTSNTITVDFSVVPTTNSVRVAVYAAVTGDNFALAVEDLTNTDITDPTAGQVLKYDGANWVNGADDAGTTISTLDDIGDVTIGVTIESGEFLKWNGSAWVNDTIDLGTDTTGNYVSDVTAGTGVSVTHTPGEGSSPSIAIGQAVASTDSPLFAGLTLTGTLTVDAETVSLGDGSSTVNVVNDLIVGGNFTVNGTTTTLNTETLAIEDNIIVLNSGITGSPTLDAGIEIERGTSDNVSLRWNETTDKWQFTDDGTIYTDLEASRSAYTIAVDNGFLGTESEWLDSLVGPVGPEGTPGEPGVDGTDGDDGFSAYEVAVSNGFTGTESEWLDSLVGAEGADGQSFIYLGDWDGSTTYNIGDVVKYGYTPSSSGPPIPSEIYISITDSNTGNEPWDNPSDWSLMVKDGEQGPTGSIDILSDVVLTSPTAGQVLKYDGDNWVNDTDDAGTTIESIDDIDDVVVTSPLQFQGLMYDGTNWVNGNIPNTYLVRNNTGSTLLKGTLVGAVGAEPSGRIDVAPFEVTGGQDSELRAMGIVVSNISNGVNGEVISFGTLTGLDTRGSTASPLAVGDETWAAGDILFAHPTVNGKLTNVRPQHDLAVAFITVRHASTGQIAIRIIPGNNHLEWMHDVSLTSPTSGDFLKWNGTVWVNDTIDLGTDTTGNYVSDVTAGTGVSVTHTPGEGSSPSIAIGQPVATTDSVTFNDVNVSSNVILTGGGSISASPSSGDIGGTITISPAGVMSGSAISGGSINILAGYAYGITTVGGDVTIDAGAGMPTNGSINIGTTTANSISIGSSGKTTTVNGALVVSGDLTVNGTTTTLNTETLAIEDNIVVLNSGVTGTPTLNAGIEVERGTQENAKLYWLEDFTNSGTGQWRVSVPTDGGGTDTGILLAEVSSLNALADVFYEAPSENNVLAWVDGAWTAVPAPVGGAVVSDTPPESPEEGALWFESDSGKTFVYTDSSWVEVGGGIKGDTGDTGPAGPAAVYDTAQAVISMQVFS